jgi:hypothetical protein
MRRPVASIATAVIIAALVAPAAQAGRVNGSWAQHGIVSDPPVSRVNGSWAQHGITTFRPYTVVIAGPQTRGHHLIDQTSAELITVLAAAAVLIGARRLARERRVIRRTVPRSGT